MVETASREKWTDQMLDDLNYAVQTKLNQLDEDTREVRADLQRLTAEVKVESNHFKEAHSASARFLEQRSSERHRPEISNGLRRGERWTEERIADLHLALSSGVKDLDGDIYELRDEAIALRTDLTARFADLDRGLLPRWRGSHHRVVHQHYSSRFPVVAVAIPANGSWTDGRLDDFNHRAGVELAGLACDIREIKSEVANLRTEMTERFRTLRRTRNRTQDRWITAVALSPIPLAILLNAALIAIRVR